MSYRAYGSTLLVSALLLFGCSTALYQASQPPPPPPPAPAESIPPQPSRAYVWVPGAYTWQTATRTYVWVPGHWTVPPPGHAWVPGHWETTPTGNVWVDGAWRPMSS